MVFKKRFSHNLKIPKNHKSQKAINFVACRLCLRLLFSKKNLELQCIFWELRGTAKKLVFFGYARNGHR